MTVRIRSIDYEHEGQALAGELAWDDSWEAARPTVLVFHDAMKSTDGFEEGRAAILAGMGYVGFAADVYGKGVHASDFDESRALMAPFQEDRRLLGRRLRASIDAAAAEPEVDPERLAAIGYCFGGMCALDLARMNAPLLGVASFHGLLTAPDPERCPPPDEPITPRVLALHGWDDPYAPPDSIEPFAREMSDRQADWQLVAYGNTLHAFTNPVADMPEMGIGFDARAERRSWQALAGFLAEIFSL